MSEEKKTIDNSGSKNKLDLSQAGCLARIIYSYVDYKDIYESIQAGFKPTLKELEKPCNIAHAIRVARYNKDMIVHILLITGQYHWRRWFKGSEQSGIVESLNRKLFFATEFGNLDDIQYFISLGADDIENALYIAVEDENLAITEYLLPLVQNAYVVSEAINIASRKNHTKILEPLRRRFYTDIGRANKRRKITEEKWDF